MKGWLTKLAAIGLSLTLAFTAAGCTETAETSKKTVPAGEKVKVFTVFQVHGDFVREIGKDQVEVDTFIPVGTNFWQYAPTLKEIADLESADMFVINGAGVEERWYDQTWATVKLKNKHLLVVDSSKDLETLKLQRFYNPDAAEEEQKKERVDPYFFMDPINAKHQVDLIAAGPIQKAPDRAEQFKKNAEEYKAKLDEIDQKYKDVLSSAKRKELVSPYAGYQYLTKRYGLKYYVPNTIALNDYPWDNPAKQEEVKAEFAKHDMKSIFFEAEAAPRVQEFLFGMGYKARILNTYEGKLPADNYKSYLAVMHENLKVLQEALNE